MSTLRKVASAALQGVAFALGYVAILFTSLALGAALLLWAVSGAQQ
jgi:hypothetical protein